MLRSLPKSVGKHYSTDSHLQEKCSLGQAGAYVIAQMLAGWPFITSRDKRVGRVHYSCTPKRSLPAAVSRCSLHVVLQADAAFESGNNASITNPAASWRSR
eukprot:6481113-Amphidinium_carterae.1